MGGHTLTSTHSLVLRIWPPVLAEQNHQTVSRQLWHSMTWQSAIRVLMRPSSASTKSSTALFLLRSALSFCFDRVFVIPAMQQQYTTKQDTFMSRAQNILTQFCLETDHLIFNLFNLFSYYFSGVSAAIWLRQSLRQEIEECWWPEAKKGGKEMAMQRLHLINTLVERTASTGV